MNEKIMIGNLYALRDHANVFDVFRKNKNNTENYIGTYHYNEIFKNFSFHLSHSIAFLESQDIESLSNLLKILPKHLDQKTKDQEELEKLREFYQNFIKMIRDTVVVNNSIMINNSFIVNELKKINPNWFINTK